MLYADRGPAGDGVRQPPLRSTATSCGSQHLGVPEDVRSWAAIPLTPETNVLLPVGRTLTLACRSLSDMYDEECKRINRTMSSKGLLCPNSESDPRPRAVGIATNYVHARLQEQLR